MSGVRNAPIASVYGDTGTVEATFTKDLNTLGSDPYVRVSANSGEFNLFQQFRLSDNFYDSRYEEVYVTQNSSGTGNLYSLVSLQFNTMGWTRVDRMYLQLPVVFNYFVSNGMDGNNSADPPLAGSWTASDTFNPTLTNLWRIVKTNLFQVSGIIDTLATWLANFTFVDWALMHMFNRIAIYGGNNNQPIGRTQTFFLEGLKQQLREVPWNAQTIKILSRIGLPVSNLYAQSSQMATSDISSVSGSVTFAQANAKWSSIRSPSGYLNFNLEEIPRDWINLWAQTFVDCDPGINGQEWTTLSNGAGTPVIHGAYTQAVILITLPLGYINNFFRHKTYLPPDFKLKIDIEGILNQIGTPNYNCPIILVNNMNTPTAYLDSTTTLDYFYNYTSGNLNTNFSSENNFAQQICFTAGLNFSTIKLIYQNHTLRQPIQAQINERWLSYPILYNYETFEVYDVDNSGNASSNMIIRDIAISQQRPTQLIFCIIDTTTALGYQIGLAASSLVGAGVPTNAINNTPFVVTGTNNTSISVASGPWGSGTIGQTPFFTDLSNQTYPITVTSALSGKAPPPFKATTIAGNTQTYNHTQYPQIQTVSVLIGGRTQYYYRNDTYLSYTTGNVVPNAYDIMQSEQNEENYKDYYTGPMQYKTPLSFSAFGGTSGYMCITIAPGGKADTAELPTDLGATVIRVQVVLSNPLPSNKKLQIWKKMPEQIAVDTNKNCTLIMWPAIKSNNGFAIPNVVNTQ